MLTFAVLVSATGGPLPEQALDRLRDPGCPEVPFDPRHHLVWSNANRTVWFGGWQDASEGASASHHWHVNDDGLTAFAGQVWPRRDGWRRTGPWARQLAEFLRSTPLRDGTDDLAGIFVAMSLQQRGHCSVAADPLGIGLIYWGHGRHVIAISSRAALAAALLGAGESREPVRDAVGAGWPSYCVYANALETGFEEVEVVPDGGCIAIDPAGSARFLSAARSPWRRGAECTASTEEMLEEARGEMATAIRMAFSRPGRSAGSELSGGKDSRLVLALLLEEGLAADVEFQTYGASDLPDVVVAREIAERFGLRHACDSERTSGPASARRRARAWSWSQRVDAAVRDQGYGTISSREIAVRITAWSGSGMNNVEKPLLGRPPSGEEALLSGACGEMLRTAYPYTSRFASKSQASGFPDQMKFGSAEILRPEVLEHYRREMHRVLFEASVANDSAQDVVDAFFFRQRLRRWLGTSLELDAQSRTFPLYSITAVRLAFAIGSESRQAEWIHYQMMRGSCEPLVHIEFADSAWSARAADDLVPVRRRDERAPCAPPRFTGFEGRRRYRSSFFGKAKQPSIANGPIRTAAGDRRARAVELDMGLMRRYLLDDPSEQHFEIFDRHAVQNALDRFTSLGELQQAQLYGALTAAIWLGGHEIALPRGIGAP